MIAIVRHLNCSSTVHNIKYPTLETSLLRWLKSQNSVFIKASRRWNWQDLYLLAEQRWAAFIHGHGLIKFICCEIKWIKWLCAHYRIKWSELSGQSTDKGEVISHSCKLTSVDNNCFILRSWKCVAILWNHYKEIQHVFFGCISLLQQAPSRINVSREATDGRSDNCRTGGFSESGRQV